MTTTFKAIMDAARVVLAATPTSRDASAMFKANEVNQNIEIAPVGITEATSVEADPENELESHGFGIEGAVEWTVGMLVKIGHGPFGPDVERENVASEDRARVLDILERQAWWPEGTQIIRHTRTNSQRPNAGTWTSVMYFQVTFIGDNRT